MKSTEFILALVAGAVLFSLTKLLSYSTSFSESSRRIDDHPPTYGVGVNRQHLPEESLDSSATWSKAARLTQRPGVEQYLLKDIALLEKKKKLLELSIQEKGLEHERDARSSAISFARDMLGSKSGAGENLPVGGHQAHPTASETTAQDSGYKSVASGLSHQTNTIIEDSPEDDVSWCLATARDAGVVSGVTWGSLTKKQDKKSWRLRNCDTYLLSGGSAKETTDSPPLSAMPASSETVPSQETLPLSPISPLSQGGVSPFPYLLPEGASGNSVKRPRVTVLVWNKINGFLDWLRDDFTRDAMKRCSTECEFTSDKRRASRAAGVLFHVKTHSKQDFPKSRAHPAQKYMMVSLEQPAYAPLMKDNRYVSKFDYQLTYDLDTTVPVITIHPHYAATEYFDAPSVPFEEKLDAAVMFTSNCKNAGAESRLAYYQELMKFMTVHSYGKCLHNINEPPKGQRSANENKRRVISKYKWYLAFENNIIKDYVSEKVFDGVLAGTVPVYYGTASVDRLLPDARAVVMVDDFANPRALAEFLTETGKDKEKYEAYLAWKHTSDGRQERIDAFQGVIDMTAYKYTSLCRICHKLSEDGAIPVVP